MLVLVTVPIVMAPVSVGGVVSPAALAVNVTADGFAKLPLLVTLIVLAPVVVAVYGQPGA